MSTKLLQIDNLITRFYTENGVVKAIDGSSFYLEEGETLGIVGESGSGKTVTALSVMQLVENPGYIESGKILFRGEDLLAKSEKQIQKIRGKDIAMVFQEPLSSLNPTITIGEQIGRVLRSHTKFLNKEIRHKVVDLLKQVGIPQPEKRAKSYPHELSGGMRQRTLIAMAISCNPTVLILDEPTTALDVIIEAQIFELIGQLKESFSMGIILITHDLAVVANSCDRVIIVYAGRIVEEADVDDLYERPLHPYTRGLLKSIPRLEEEGKGRLCAMSGEVPDLINLPDGCNFSPRCPYADDRCWQVDPQLEDLTHGRRVACWRFKEIGE